MFPDRNSKQQCPLERDDETLFFSLVNYRNILLTSNDPKKILEFYNGFDNRDQLIRWMKERPKGSTYIHEVEGDKDIVVVIPTANFNGIYAVNCRENIFKGLHIIFVENGGKDDFYFNYAHSCNVGIKKAMDYNPKWVVVSNDDMIKIDGPDVLKNCLGKIDPNEINTVFTKESPNHYHSVPAYFGRPNFMGKLYLEASRKFRTTGGLFYSYIYTGNKLIEKYQIDTILIPKRRISKFFFSKIKPIYMTMSFGIFSRNYLSKNDLFNESFINGAEDWDLSFRLFYKDKDYEFIDYLIGEKVGETIGKGDLRAMRDVANIALFNYITQS